MLGEHPTRPPLCRPTISRVCPVPCSAISARWKSGSTGSCSIASERRVPEGLDRLDRRHPQATDERPHGRAVSYAVSARPNVHALGWRPQETIAAYNRAFDVCLIPYRTDHPFNRACSPTKIMDYMGTGRPIVSTALPECRLYDHLFHVAADSSTVHRGRPRRSSTAGSDDGRASSGFELRPANTCRHVRRATSELAPRLSVAELPARPIALRLCTW